MIWDAGGAGSMPDPGCILSDWIVLWHRVGPQKPFLLGLQIRVLIPTSNCYCSGFSVFLRSSPRSVCAFLMLYLETHL